MALPGVLQFASGILIATVALPGACLAEEDGEATIVVSARRVDEPQNQVPLQVDTIAAKEIGASSVESLQSLSLRVPALSFEAAWGGFNSFPVLRGQSQPSVAGDNVGMFVDGVYQASRDAIDVVPLDLERIEVVEGPQSALFGHSSFAGLISYVPALPTEQPYLAGSIDLGGDNLHGVSGTISGPTSDAFKARLALAFSAANGTYRNRADPGQHLGDSEKFALAASLATRDGSGPLSARISLRYGDNRFSQPAFSTLDYHSYDCGSRDPAAQVWSYYCGPAPIAAGVALSPAVPESRSRTGQAALHLALDVGSATLRSDTSFYRASSVSFRDFDGSAQGELFGVCQLGVNCTGIGSLTIPVVRLQYVNILTRRELSVREVEQELRFGSNGRDGFEWQAGATIFWTDTQTTAAVGADRGQLGGNENFSSLFLSNLSRVGRPAVINAALVADSNASQVTQNETEEHRRTIAVFATADWRIVDGVRLRGEARAEWESLSLDSVLSNFAPSFGTSLGTKRFHDVTPRVSLSYGPASDWLLFASYARGARSGGINPVPGLLPQEQTYAPESNWTAELGVKYAGSGLVRSAWLTAYDIDWRNTQIVGFSITPGVNSLITHNTAGIHTRGFELGGSLAPLRGLELDFAYSHADPRFKQGSEDPGSSAFCGLALGISTSSFCTIVPSVVIPGQLVPDISGNTPARAVRNSWSVQLAISPPLPRLRGIRLRAGIEHEGNVFDRQIDGLFYGARTLVSARLVIPLGHCSLELWGTNLGDAHYVRIAVARGPAYYRDIPRPTDLILGDGRRLGVTLRFAR